LDTTILVTHGSPSIMDILLIPRFVRIVAAYGHAVFAQISLHPAAN